MAPKKKKCIFISSISSDIGLALAERYSRDGYKIAGTYRSKKLLPRLKKIPDRHLLFSDLSGIKSIKSAAQEFSKLKLRWETFMSCAAWPLPLTSFFKSDFDEWSNSVHVNAIEQLRVLHSLYPYRDKSSVSNVIFFAGPGTNNAPKNFSALVLSKLMLIKMCELIDAENEDLNVFIVGPGWTQTKTHEIILKAAAKSSEKYKETMNFVQNKIGTSMDDIYDCLRWLSAQGKKVSSGRNFSVVHDYWKTSKLALALAKDSNMYKMRRYGNEWSDKGDPRK